MADRTASAELVIGARVGGALAGFSAVDLKLGQLGRQVKSLGRGLAEFGLGWKAERFFEGSIGAAADMAGEMAHVATSFNDGALQVQHVAEAERWANKAAENGVISNIHLAEGIYRTRSAGLDMAAAMAAAAQANTLVQGTMRDAEDATTSYEPAARLLADTFNNFGDKTRAAIPQINAFGDSLARLQTRYAFASIGEVIYALQYASPAAKAAGVAFNQMNATIALLSESGLHGAEAGTAAQELFSNIASNGKMAGFAMRDAMGGLDVSATLERMNNVFGRMPKLLAEKKLREMGFGERDVGALILTMGRYREFGSIVTDLDHSQGAAAANQKIRQAAADAQLAQLANRWGLFKETLGASLIPALLKVISALKPVVSAMVEFANTRPGITALAMGLLGVAAAAVTLGGVVRILGVFKTATQVATAAQWLFNAALDANPIGLAILAVAALATAAYEIYKHWAGIAGFFKTLWSDVLGVFRGVVTAISNFGLSMYQAGRNFMVMLAKGIIDAALAPVRAASDIAHRIGRFFIGHSPIPEGALHDMDIGREIAATIKPGPVVAAVRQLAAAATLAIPLTISPAMRAIVPAPVTVPPAIYAVAPAIAMNAVAPAIAARAPGAELAMTPRSSPTTQSAPAIHFGDINVKVEHRGGRDDDIEARVRAGVEEALEKSGYKLSQILRRERENQDRTKY